MARGPALVVVGREKAQAYEPTAGKYEVCISITDPMSPPANLSPNFRAVLRLCFHDIDARVPAGMMTDCGPAQHMSPRDADRVVAFVLEHEDADVLMIHCEMGVSRSRSIAEALFDVYGRRNPNQWVYQAVLRAAKKGWGDGLPAKWIDFRWLPLRRGPRG